MKTLGNISKSILLILTLSLGSIKTFSQEEGYNSAELQNKNWQLQGMVDKSEIDIYTMDALTVNIDNTYMMKFEYYLSNSVDKQFDKKKVGTNTVGKYIVRRPIRDKDHPTQPQITNVYEIIELSSKKLIVRNIDQPYLLEFKAK